MFQISPLELLVLAVCIVLLFLLFSFRFKRK